jgi:hypothetical protein
MNILINSHFYIYIHIYINTSIHSHVWMETPDANVSDARQFMDLVNEHLAPHGLFARYKCICIYIHIYVLKYECMYRCIFVYEDTCSCIFTYSWIS